MPFRHVGILIVNRNANAFSRLPDDPAWLTAPPTMAILSFASRCPKKLLPRKSATSNICRKEFSAAAIRESSRSARKAAQFLPKANRSPDAISAAYWVIFFIPTALAIRSWMGRKGCQLLIVHASPATTFIIIVGLAMSSQGAQDTWDTFLP